MELMAAHLYIIYTSKTDFFLNMIGKSGKCSLCRDLASLRFTSTYNVVSKKINTKTNAQTPSLFIQFLLIFNFENVSIRKIRLLTQLSQQ